MKLSTSRLFSAALLVAAGLCLSSSALASSHGANGARHHKAVHGVSVTAHRTAPKLVADGHPPAPKPAPHPHHRHRKRPAPTPPNN
jgi:hypothetical protein